MKSVIKIFLSLIFFNEIRTLVYVPLEAKYSISESEKPERHLSGISLKKIIDDNSEKIQNSPKSENIENLNKDQKIENLHNKENLNLESSKKKVKVEKNPEKKINKNSEKKERILLENKIESILPEKKINENSEKKERNLSQIKVSENSQKKPPKILNKEIDLHSMFLKNVDDLIKNYGINKKIDKQKIDGYFDGLGDKLFNNMKKKFLSDKKYKKRYNKINGVYKRLKEEYLAK